MLKRFTALSVFTAATLFSAFPLCAQTKPADDATYQADLVKRATGILNELKLEDPEKADRVKAILIAQYKDLRALDEARDTKLKGVPKEDKEAIAKVKGQRADAAKALHEQFLAKLNAELTPEQLEKVKDQMTYNVVQVTYDAFCDMLPELTETQKAYILEQLKLAREEAMDGGSSGEKHAIFGKYKGRINNYLSKEGYDLKKATKQWQERLKARRAQATRPA